MSTESSTIEAMGKHGTIKYYIIGLIICLTLTLGAFYLVSEDILSGWTLYLVLTVLALIQVYFQLTYFLHLGDEPKPYWNLIVFLFMAFAVVILVAGTLWIMHELDVRMMGTETM